jgi:hypothetical protein
METSLIEQYDKSRYSLMKWLTIGWAVWYGTFISKNLINNRIILVILFIAGSIGWILFAVNLIRTLRLGKKINADSTLKEALNNEMHQLYMYKSFFFGFWIVLATTCIFIVIASFHQISALIVCEVTLFFGVLSFFVAWLVFNKE